MLQNIVAFLPQSSIFQKSDQNIFEVNFYFHYAFNETKYLADNWRQKTYALKLGKLIQIIPGYRPCCDFPHLFIWPFFSKTKSSTVVIFRLFSYLREFSHIDEEFSPFMFLNFSYSKTRTKSCYPSPFMQMVLEPSIVCDRYVLRRNCCISFKSDAVEFQLRWATLGSGDLTAWQSPPSKMVPPFFMLWDYVMLG